MSTKYVESEARVIMWLLFSYYYYYYYYYYYHHHHHDSKHMQSVARPVAKWTRYSFTIKGVLHIFRFWKSDSSIRAPATRANDDGGATCHLSVSDTTDPDVATSVGRGPSSRIRPATAVSRHGLHPVDEWRQRWHRRWWRNSRRRFRRLLCPEVRVDFIGRRRAVGLVADRWEDSHGVCTSSPASGI